MKLKLKLDEISVKEISNHQCFKYITKEEGITLVALIITIIVLIILAAVTIFAFTETGLLQTASKGTENYVNAQEYEKQIMDNIDNHAKDVVKNIADVQEGNEAGEENPPILEEPTMPEKWDGTKVYTYKSKDNKVVPVPNGFTVSEVPEEQSVKTGLVIKITQDGVTSEFVWVPVPNTSEMFGVNKNGNNLGKLYTFSKSGDETIVTANNWKEAEVNGKEVMNWKDTANSREPDIVTYYDGIDAKSMAIFFIEAISTTMKGAQFNAQLQEEFNAMKASIEKYDGFYIGRYETGDLSKTKASVSKNNSDIASQNWYVQYQRSKTIVDGKSSMIWGCQWDAVMKWFLSSEDEETKKYVTDSTRKGNYVGTNGSKVIPTGSNSDYAVNNIYDMAGNVADWTLEANTTSNRMLRRRKL